MMIKKFKIIPIVIALSLGLMACAGTDDPVVPTDDKAVETPSASEDLPALKPKQHQRLLQTKQEMIKVKTLSRLLMFLINTRQSILT